MECVLSSGRPAADDDFLDFPQPESSFISNTLAGGRTRARTSGTGSGSARFCPFPLPSALSADKPFERVTFHPDSPLSPLSNIPRVESLRLLTSPCRLMLEYDSLGLFCQPRVYGFRYMTRPSPLHSVPEAWTPFALLHKAFLITLPSRSPISVAPGPLRSPSV